MGEGRDDSIQTAIRRQALQSAFATEAAFLVAAERTRRVELVVGVGPDDAGAQLVDDLENLAAFVRPHARAQAVRRVVRALERLLRRAERHHTQYRSENFLLRYAMRRGDAREKSRRIPIAALRQRATGVDKFRTFRHAALHQLADFFQLRFVVDRADVGVFIQRIAEAQGLDAVA